MDLENKVAIVTGGGSGIGREVCIKYAAEGAKVIIADLNEKGAAETLEQIKAQNGEAVFFKANAGSAEDNKALVEEAVKLYGGLHIACNNAGIGGPLAPTGEYPLDGWNKVIGINLTGVFYALRYQIPAMLAVGGGAIVNMASILGRVGTKFSPAYVAAKHGLVGLTKAAALEYSNQNIRINAVGPGYILTPLLTNTLTQEQLDGLVNLHPIGRIGRPQEIAELVLWLSSPKASFVTGSYYAADGGYLAQ